MAPGQDNPNRPPQGSVDSITAKPSLVWPGGRTFSEYAHALKPGWAREVAGHMDQIEKELVARLPAHLIDFPNADDRRLALLDYTDQQELARLSNEASSALEEVVRRSLLAIGFKRAGRAVQNPESTELAYEQALAHAMQLAHKAIAWRNTLVRKHGNLEQRVESIESRLDEVARFRVSLAREQAGALRTATGGAVKLMLTISAALSASLATWLSAAADLGAPFATATTATFAIGLGSIGSGVGYVLHHRSVLRTELGRLGRDDDRHLDPNSVAAALGEAERRPRWWLRSQGILLIVQVTVFGLALWMFMDSVVIGSNETARPASLFGT